jgi:hypothetical protein
MAPRHHRTAEGCGRPDKVLRVFSGKSESAIILENAPSPSPRSHRGPTGAGPLFTHSLTESGDFTATDKKGDGLIDKVTRVEKLEAELNAMIERRARKDPDPDELEPSYAESVRRYHEGRRRGMAIAWRGFHLEQAERIERTAAALAASHREKARALLGEGA